MDLRKWLRISFFNLLIVALAGVVLRYKILFPLPFVDQKNLLHGHSHFAFSGWMAQVLMALIVNRLPSGDSKSVFQRYGRVLWLNLVCAWGMLLSFPVQGYGLVSIVFSNGAIATAIWFGILLFRDTRRLDVVEYKWYRAAAAFNIFSAAGAFSLAYMMATHHMQPDRYLASVYFFLHFQYNGFFSFTVLGLLASVFQSCEISYTRSLAIFRFFLYASVPAYFLSVLWYKLPAGIYALAVIAVVAQLAGWMLTLAALWRSWPGIKQKFPGALSLVLGLSIVAFSIKILLQSASVFPEVSTLAFGFRPIVIGYLHLVLLGFVTLFLIAYCRNILIPTPGTTLIAGTWIFTSGIILNECVLMIQGVGDLCYFPVPGLNAVLFVIALILALGMMLFNLGISAKKRTV
jgi:hypothetical protein